MPSFGLTASIAYICVSITCFRVNFWVNLEVKPASYAPPVGGFTRLPLALAERGESGFGPAVLCNR